MTDSIKDILVKRVDVPMLRRQRDELLEVMPQFSRSASNILEGLVSLLDYMLDVAEGFEV